MAAGSRTGIEQSTGRWLAGTLTEGLLHTHEMPAVWDDGGHPAHLSQKHFGYLQRKLKIFRWLERMRFESFVDVASGWEHYPFLVRERYGAETYYSDLVHEMNLPKDGELFGKRDHAVTLNLASLPFRDAAFDVVLCSEVLEHLVRPVEAISELLRVTRKYLILTSLEALSPSRWQRFWAHHRVDVRVPHVERNFLLARELRAIFGDDVRCEPLQDPNTLPASSFDPPSWRDAAYERIRDRAALVDALVRAAASDDPSAGGMGLLLVKAMPGAEIVPARPGSDHELAGWLIDQAVRVERYQRELMGIGNVLKLRPELLPADYLPQDRPVADRLVPLLQCPDCRGALENDGPAVECLGCRTRFPAEFGVPVLYPRDPERAVSEAACLDRLCAGDARRRRAVRRVMRRLRRNERPPGPLRRAAWRIEGMLGLTGAEPSPR